MGVERRGPKEEEAGLAVRATVQDMLAWRHVHAGRVSVPGTGHAASESNYRNRQQDAGVERWE